MADHPWIELAEFEGGWQAMFACQVCLKPFSELLTGRWGFNAQALLTEALDRQKLFVESQHNGNVLEESLENQRTLALRCIRLPEKGLLLALIGKICAPTPEQAQEQAEAYCHELISVVPTDFRVHPACYSETFNQLTGQELLAQCHTPQQLAQILRIETSLRAGLYVYGFWQTAERSDEQIWRVLGNYPQPVLLNISLRPTQLQFNERQVLWDMNQQPSPNEEPAPYHVLQPLNKWSENLITRRLPLWKKFYYLQLHIACPTNVVDSLTRPIGTALTREAPDLVAPGFVVRQPGNQSEAQGWAKNLSQLNLALSEININALSRLSDIADLNEAHAVFRLPYPPEAGLPGIKFLDPIET